MEATTREERSGRPRSGAAHPAKRIAAATAFVVVLLSIWVGGHVYMARALVLGLGEPLERLGLALLCALGATVVVQPIAERRFGPRAVRPLSWIASVWMGFAFFVVLLLLLSDAVALLLGLEWTPGSEAARTRAAVVALAALAVAGVAFTAAWRRRPVTTRCEIASRRWPSELDGFRIVQISDIHIGPLLDRDFSREIVERVHALGPDLIAVTGDLVDGLVEHLHEDVAPLGDLRAPHGVWFVTGNHDYYSGVGPWLEQVRRLGMRPLENERVVIETANGAFELAGVNDRLGGLFGHPSDVPAALDGWTRERALILLAHDPTTFHEAWRHGIDLQISGHTHGGQLFPFGWIVRLVVGFVAGHYRRGEAQLLVSCGTGFWGPPMRLGAPAEITEIVLRPLRAEAS